MLHGMSERATIHVPVMPREVIEWLDPRAGQVIVDGTLGGGGHTRLLAELIAQGAHAPRSPSDASSDSFVLALDRDPAPLAAAEKTLAGLPVKIAQANFCDLDEVLDELGIAEVDGVLLDLGLSSDQLADDSRGFSFEAAGELDLRFDTDEGEPAWRLLARGGQHDRL